MTEDDSVETAYGLHMQCLAQRYIVSMPNHTPTVLSWGEGVALLVSRGACAIQQIDADVWKGMSYDAELQPRVHGVMKLVS